MMSRKIAGLFLAVSLMSPVGFSAKHDKNHNDAFIPGAIDESRIARDVRHQLVMLPYYGVFDDLAFRVDGSTVTLLGYVTRPTLKSDAENVVKRIEGVSQVNNEIEVLPLSPNDDRIRLATYRAIFGSPSIADRNANPALPSIPITSSNE